MPMDAKTPHDRTPPVVDPQILWNGLAEAKAALDAASRCRDGDGEEPGGRDEAAAEERAASCRERLIEHYLPLVQRVADRLCRSLPGSVTPDELLGEGVFGLLDAIDQFDGGRNVRFETFAPQRIRGAMLDHLRALDWRPRLVRARARKVDHVVQSFEGPVGRPPSRWVLLWRLAPRRAVGRRIVRDGTPVRQMPLDGGRRSEDDEHAFALADVLEDRDAAAPPVTVERHDLRRAVLEDLSRRDRLILLLYYSEGMAMKEVADVLNISESRVSQIHKIILEHLRATLGSTDPVTVRRAA